MRKWLDHSPPEIMDRDFEKYRGGPTVATTERMHVTISKSGRILFNKNLHRLLGKPLAVYLYFSRVKDIIAIEPSSPRLPESFPVRESRANWIINASPFCKHFGITIDSTMRFINPDIRDGKLLLNLSETVTVRQNRRKQKS